MAVTFRDSKCQSGKVLPLEEMQEHLGFSLLVIWSKHINLQLTKSQGTRTQSFY